MKYVGLDSQIRRNNFNSILLLIAFPVLLLGMGYALLYFTRGEHQEDPNQLFLQIMPVVLAAVGIWLVNRWTERKIKESITWWRISAFPRE